jgi:predicted DNA-binding antitoxin AbrB/MazE fold protein
MSEQTIIAVYHEGVFHPATPEQVTLHEGDTVELSIKKIDEVVDSERLARVKRIMEVIDHFYEGLDDDKIDDIESAILRRVNFDTPENKAQFD